MLGNVLCTTMETNVVEMYELLDNDYESPPRSIPQHQLADYISANKVPGIRLLKHLKDHDHTKQITALCSCPCLGVFATTSNDGSLKIWDQTNTMVRELWFDETLRSVCFANDRGDLLVGFQNHISYVSITSYLPLSYMKELLEREFQDEIVEEPFPFNPDLPLWFDLLSLPTYPTDLLLRQHVKRKLPQLRKQILGIPIPGSASKEGSRQTSEADMKVTSESTVGRHISRLASFQQITAQTKTGDVPSNGTSLQAHVQRENNRREDKKKTEEPETEREKLALGERRKDGDGRSMGGDGEGVVKGGAGEDQKEKEELVTEFGPEEEEEEEDMVKEKIIQLLVAPDGYIPNSVIRMLVRPPKPPTPPPPPEEWRPRSVPTGDLPVAARGSLEDTEYENHEPFTWASSEESTVSAETLAATPSPQASASLAAKKQVAKQPVVAATEKEVAEVNQHKIRKLSLKTVGKLVISHPGMSEERERTVLSKKKRRKGRGINTEQSTRQRYGKVSVLDDIQGEKEGSGDDEAAEDEEDEERGPLDRLLNRITSMDWYPKGLKMDVLTVVKTLLNLLDNASDELYKFICSALIELNNIVGLSENLLDSIVRKYLRDLKSSLFTTRLNAIKTLANLHDNRPFVVLSVLNSMTDEEASVQQEAAEALDKLAGISTKEAMEKYLASIGILSQHQEDPLADLARRCRLEKQRGESALLTSVTSVVERRLSSISPPGGQVYSPERVEEWLERLFRDRQLYEYKHKGKPHAPIQKKKRRMSLAHRPLRQVGQGEDLEDEIREEEFESDEEEEEDEEEDYFDGTDEGMSEGDSLPDQDHTALEEQHPRQRKLNKHEAMMLAKEASMQREKLLMEKKAKEKMRKHIEEYEKAMKRKRRKMKHFLPYHAGFYSYYDRMELLERQGRLHHRHQPRRLGPVSKSIMTSVSDLAGADSSTMETSQSAWEQEKSSAHLEEDAHESNDRMSCGSSLTPDRRKKLGVALGGDVLSGDESVRPIKTRGAGTHIHLERKKWKMCDQLFAEGHATPWHPKFGGPDKRAGDSGLGDSMATGPSQLLTLESSGQGGATSDTLFDIDHSGRGVVPANKSDPRDKDVRPKSNLTMANLRRHELLSAHTEKQEDSSHCSGNKGLQPRANWRDFFHLPEIQERRQQYEALRVLRDAQSRSLATEGGAPFHHLSPAAASNRCCRDGKADTIINCIPRGVAFAPGSSGRRLLHTVTMGSRGKGQDYSVDVELARHMGRQGTTNFGTLQMSWACVTPQKGSQQRVPDLVAPPTERVSDVPSHWRARQEGEDRRCCEVYHRNWLRTQMLYPSLFKLQEIDLAKQRIANAAHPTRCEDTFRWERPLPIVISKATSRVCRSHHSNCAIGQQSRKPKQLTVEKNSNCVTDSSSEQEVADGTPIVPRNSMASTGDPVTLPALMCGPNRDQVPMGAKITRKPRPLIKAKS